MTSSSTKAPAKPSAGDARAGKATLCTTPCHSTPFDPDWTSAAPIRFATAATKTAARGESARVETEVATALAVSWNPLVKSKPSATTTTTQTNSAFIGSPGRSDGTN